jgi:putative spermidine/putrescine transport system ATP-binding protein
MDRPDLVRADHPLSQQAPALSIRGVSKSYGATVALTDVQLELPGGQLICFLGPSGCGKTTLLRIIAGLESVGAGSVHLGQRELTHVPTHQRNVGMVFQSFALFPHLSVAENIAYGLRIRGVGAKERRQRADELLELVQLPGLGSRGVAQLSGGQRQRVAMARALALKPDLFLLDEPLSALDAKLREAMQVELRRLQRQVGITTIIVTHDQEEALTMADLVVVMGDNRVQQVGSPLDVYRRPVNRFVAGFIGTNNFLAATVGPQGGVSVLGQRLELQAPAGATGQLTLAIRPEDVRLHASQPAGAAFEGRVTFVRDLGRTVETFVRLGDSELSVLGAAPLAEGTPVWLEFPPEGCVILQA